MDRPVARRLACLLLASLPACGDDSGVTSSATETLSDPSAASTDTAAPDPTTEAASSTGEPPASTGADDPGYDPPPAMCGNGYVEADEECDDGNDAADDGCTNACEVPCGLKLQVVELAPTAESELSAQSVAIAPDGGFVVVAFQREITSDQEGSQTAGPATARVVRYTAEGELVWDRLIGADDNDFTPAGGVIDAAGDVYVAGALEGEDATDISIRKLAAVDGEQVWAHVHDGLLPAGEDAPTGLALAPDDSVVVVGTVRDVDNDDDVWVRKLSAANGKEIWTSTWSGAGNGEFSVDKGGRVAVAPDGTIYASAQEYVDYKTNEAVLLKFSPQGGDPEWVFSPLADGQTHLHLPGWVSVDERGAVLFTATRTQNVVPAFWLYKLDADQKVLWSFDREPFIDEEAGDNWSLGSAAFGPGGGVTVTGYYRAKDKMASLAWFRIWTARLNPAGEKRCQVEYTAPGSDLVPPSVYSFALAVGGDDTAVASGELIVEGESQLWTGLFRAP